jgi:hypothetical protein
MSAADIIANWLSFMRSPLSSLNAIHPDRMTADERLAEIAEILAGGLMRLRARKSSPLSREHGESFLDFSAHQHGHAPRKENA